MSKPSEEQIAAFKAQHGELYCITVGEEEYYLRKPKRPEYKRFIDTVQKSTYEASLALVLDCLVFPSRDEFIKACDTNPSLHLLISAELQERIGGGQAVSSKNV